MKEKRHRETRLGSARGGLRSGGCGTDRPVVGFPNGPVGSLGHGRRGDGVRRRWRPAGVAGAPPGKVPQVCRGWLPPSILALRMVLETRSEYFSEFFATFLAWCSIGFFSKVEKLKFVGKLQMTAGDEDCFSFFAAIFSNGIRIGRCWAFF